jgi:hypothetical protein
MPFRRAVGHFIAGFQFDHEPIVLDRTTVLCFFCEIRTHFSPPYAARPKGCLSRPRPSAFENITAFAAVKGKNSLSHPKLQLRKQDSAFKVKTDFFMALALPHE